MQVKVEHDLEIILQGWLKEATYVPKSTLSGQIKSKCHPRSIPNLDFFYYKKATELKFNIVPEPTVPYLSKISGRTVLIFLVSIQLYSYHTFCELYSVSG